MARKTKHVSIPQTDGSRDSGKVYLLTEMSAVQAERWALRGIQILARAGISMPVNPEDPAEANMAAMASFGWQNLLRAVSNSPVHELIEWLDEMLECVKIVRNQASPDFAVPIVEEAEDIAEVKTRMLLRMEVFELQTGFSLAEILQKLKSISATK